MSTSKYILTLSCPDQMGVVHTVSGFLFERGGNIIDSAQFNDTDSDRFFMRVNFEERRSDIDLVTLKTEFAPIAERFDMDWQLVDEAAKPRLMIMVSKIGHCLNDLLYRQRIGQLSMDVVAVVSNHPDLEPLAQWHGIPYHHFALDPANKPAQEARVWQVIEDTGAELVILARYMQVLSPELCRKLDGKAINIHHSLLPGFKGAKPYHQAYEKGVKLVGATAHYINNDLDEGPIIAQGVEVVDHSHYPEDLIAKGRDIEAQTLARGVGYHIERRVFLNGGRTVVL